MDYIIFPKKKELNMRLAVTFQKRQFLKRKYRSTITKKGLLQIT